MMWSKYRTNLALNRRLSWSNVTPAEKSWESSTRLTEQGDHRVSFQLLSLFHSCWIMGVSVFLEFRKFKAWVEVDKKRLRCYATSVDKKEKTVSCWIASEEEKVRLVIFLLRKKIFDPPESVSRWNCWKSKRCPQPGHHSFLMGIEHQSITLRKNRLEQPHSRQFKHPTILKGPLNSPRWR